MASAQDIPALPKFDCNGENVSIQWKKWKRAFNLYIKARNITSDERKVATLLSIAGMDVQDIYFSIVGEEEKQYSECLQVLDDYFVPKSNAIFERYEFRQMQQANSETVDAYVCRLRKKAETCEFNSTDDAIRDQLLDSCHSGELKRKFLEKSEKATLKDFQEIGRAYESVETQMKSLTVAEKVNTVGKKKTYSQPKTQSKTGQQKINPEQRCFKCNRIGHFAKDPNCPAKGVRCSLCTRIGHFQVCCRFARQHNEHPPTPKKQAVLQGARPKQWSRDRKSKVQNVTSGNECYDDKYSENDFAFCINANKSVFGFTDLEVGDVDLNGVLIDSGASCNLIDKQTWESLKRENIRCTSKAENKALFAYGQAAPLSTLGTFRCVIVCKDTGRRCLGEFTVINSRGRPIIGKSTAERLNVLRVGPPTNKMVQSVVCEGTGEDFIKSYPEVFSGVGKLKNYQLKLHINRNVQPVVQSSRRIPYSLRDKVDKKLDELLDLDVIEYVPEKEPSTWVSPLVCIPKRDSDVRICVDMRRANSAIERERHPIPTIDDVLHELNGATVFSKLDVKMAFHQIELDPNCRDVTTFTCHRGLMRYKRLNFGITSAPEHYQHIVKDILRSCEGVANIADDIVVYGSGVENHDKRMHNVLRRLMESGLTLNPEKCEFRVPKLTFFGHDLSENGISPSEEKVKAIKNAEAPKSASEVRSFLGLVQYSSRFIPNFSEISEPLRRLTRKNTEFKWESEQDKAFRQLKEILSGEEALAYFKYGCKTRIISDAGPTAIGAVLVQLQNGVWRVVSYASRTLTDVERRYCQTEKEALGLVWACERFSLYVFGTSFELETDHKPLEHIYSVKSKPSARIERWVLRLQGYDYTVVYRPGKTNIADALSRLRISNNVDNSGDNYDFVRMIAQESTPIALSPREVERASEHDEELVAVRECISKGNWDKCNLPAKSRLSYLCVKEELCVLGKLVLRNSRIVVPRALRERVLSLAHEGHPGIVKMKSLLRTKVWWPNLDKDVENLCKTCHACQVVGPYSNPEPMERVKPSGPWQDLACDCMGPMPTGEQLFVIVDYYSRYLEAVAIRNVTPEAIIGALEPIFARFGFPFTLKTDNASYFKSQIFQNFLEEHGIVQINSPPLWPQANGEVERQNRTLLKSLKTAEIEGKQWKKQLPKILLQLRSTPHASTGVTPAYMMFGREIKTKLPELRADKSMLDEEIRDRDWKNKLYHKEYADKNRNAKEATLEVGDKVLIRNEISGKLDPAFQNKPGVVKDKLGSEITVLANGKEYKRNSTFFKQYHEKGQNGLRENSDPCSESSESLESQRPVRNRKPPDRLNITWQNSKIYGR